MTSRVFIPLVLLRDLSQQHGFAYDKINLRTKMLVLALVGKTSLTGGKPMICTATELSDYLVGKAKADGVELTPLKLQKILYYIQGWYLAFTDKPVFDEDVLAWRYGPVVYEVYSRFSRFGATDITKAYNPSDTCSFEAEDKAIIDSVWEKYKNKTPGDLVTMTHLSTPWIKVYSDPNNDIIYTDLMRDYFKQYAQPKEHSGHSA